MVGVGRRSDADYQTSSLWQDLEYEYGCPDKAAVKKWYDGFIFGDVKDIYNPWSIINFLDKGKLTTYWANTSGNSLVSRLMRKIMSGYC